VRLRPGAFHLMLVDLAASLADGDTIDVTLRFERAPDATVRVPVRRR
jgi:copper(I)-binding protein